MSIVELASKLLGVATGLVALLVAAAGLTKGSRRRRLESYYKAAADDEKGRSPEREAILRSLQREVVGWSIATHVVPKSQLIVPLVAYVYLVTLQFFSGRFLARDLAAGKRVWFGITDLMTPETPVGAVVFGGVLNVLLVTPLSVWVQHYFAERRRIATEYLMGAPTLVQKTVWRRLMEERLRREEKLREAPVELPRTAGNADVEPDSARKAGLFLLRAAGSLAGSVAFATFLGFASVGQQIITTQAGPWIFLLGASGLTALALLGSSFFLNAFADRALSEWRHPAVPLDPLRVPPHRLRARVTPVKRVPRRRGSR